MPFSPSPIDLKDAGTVVRVVRLLRLVAELDAPLTIKRLCERTGLTPSTVHRLLDLLLREGLVEREAAGRTYRIGAEYYRVAALVFHKVPFHDIAGPILRDAAEAMGETCYFALYMRAEGRLMFVEKADSPHPLNYRIEFNRPFSLVWGSSGRVILAHLPPDVARELVERETEPNHAGLVPPTWSDLCEELATIRHQGYAYSHSQRIPDGFGVLAPVFDHHDDIYGALGFTIPRTRFEQHRIEDIARVAKRYAARLSAALGAGSQGAGKAPRPRP